jgi:enamine deaminase RidA (YjgF/YER057c/UK114 family)
MAEYKGPLNAHGVKYYNIPGLGVKISNLLHISSAVVIPFNKRTVVISGQTGYDANMELPPTLGEEIMNAFKNVEESLAAAGVKDGFKSVYSMTSFHTHSLNDEDAKDLDAAVQKHFQGNRPTWTAIGVRELYGGCQIEITAWAVLPDED